MEVKHDPVGQKFYIDLGGKEAILTYKIVNDIMDMHFIFVPETHGGKGFAKLLTENAFEFARKKKLKVIPKCSYVNNKFLK